MQIKKTFSNAHPPKLVRDEISHVDSNSVNCHYIS